MLAIYAKELSKRYGNLEVLKGVNLEIKEGEFYALMGPNGSGKTTLVSIIASVLTPSEGEVKIYGKGVEEMKRIISYVPQENFSSPMLTGRENLIYFARLMGYPKEKAREITEELLKKIGLEKEADKRVSAYSGGMRKKLEIATAFFPDVKIMILDEPTTGLDPSARRAFLGLIQEMKKEDATVLLVTHIGSDAEVASRVGFMNEGRIIAEGSPDDLKKRSELKQVISVDTLIKNRKVKEVLEGFSEGKLLETEGGYRLYSEEDADKIIPEIVRALDGIGCKVTRINAERPTLEDVFFKLTRKGLGG